MREELDGIDIIEGYCRDCSEVFFVSQLSERKFSHCLSCGGVNVDTFYYTLTEYLETEYGIDLGKEFERKAEDVWYLVKNLNTDDELDEIERLLFS